MTEKTKVYEATFYMKSGNKFTVEVQALEFAQGTYTWINNLADSYAPRLLKFDANEVEAVVVKDKYARHVS